MKITFPITNDIDFAVCLAISAPKILDIDYAEKEVRDKYYSMSQEERDEIKKFITSKLDY